MIRACFRGLCFTIGWGTVLFIVLFAVLISMGRILSPLAEDYRPQLMEAAETSLGQPVRLERMAVVWRGLVPALDLQGLRVLDEQGKTVLSARHVFVTPGIGALFEGRLAPGRITIEQADLALELTEDGRVVIPGLLRSEQPPKSGGQGLQERLADLLDGLVVELVDSRVQWIEQERGVNMGFEPVSLVLAVSSDRIQLDGHAGLPREMGRDVRLTIDLEGDYSLPRAWRARLLLQAEGLRVKGLPAGALLRRAGLHDGTGSVLLWLEVAEGRTRQAVGSMQLEDIELATPDGAGRIRLDALKTRFRWQPLAAGWRLDLARLQLIRKGREWPETSASLALEREEDETRMRLHSSFLRLEDLAGLALARRELPASARQWAERIRPQGDLRNLRLAVMVREGKLVKQRLQADFDGLGWSPWQRIPGMDGLSGALELAGTRARLTLDSRELTLKSPWLMQRDVPIERLQGVLVAEQEGDRLNVTGTGLSLATAHVHGSGELALAMGRDLPPELKLRLDFADGDAAHVRDYLPRGILKPKLARWLERAFVSGRVTEGSLLYRGPFHGFPFNEHQGHFEVRFAAENGVLDYWPGWPRLEGLAGEVIFLNQRLEVHAERGEAGRSRIEKGVATIPDLKRSRLGIDLEAAGPLDGMLDFVRASPLRKGREALLDALKVSGPARLGLKLDIPISHRLKRHKIDVDGQLSLKDARVGFPSLGYRLEKVTTEARFHRDALFISKGTARLDGHPLQIRADTTAEHEIHLDLEGRLPATYPARYLDAAWRKRIDGASNWRVRVVMDGRGKRTPLLQVDSSLEGVRIDLPAPLNKQADARWPLQVELPLHNTELLPVSLRLDDRLAARLEVATGAEPGLHRAALRFGSDTVPELPEQGMALLGRVGQLDLDAWTVILASPGSKSQESESLRRLHRIDLFMEELAFSGRKIHDLRVNAVQEGRAWKALVECPWVMGRVEWPMAGGGSRPIDLELDYLDLDHPDLKQAVQGQPVRPEALPPLSLSVRSLQWGGKRLRKVQLGTAPQRDALRIHGLSMEGDGFRGHLTGIWWHKGDSRERTQIDYTFDVSDLGRMTRFLNLQSGLQKGEGRIAGTLAWPGAPSDLSVQPGLDGRVELDLKKGVITGVDTGAGKLLGLFNIDELGRRLRLDFKDLPGEGLGYDRLQGEVRVQGVRLLARELKVESSTAHVLLRGEADMARRTLRLEMDIVPQVYSATVPIAGAVVGGPLAGAALYLLGKINSLDQKFNRGTRIEYRITGSWDAPKVERMVVDQDAIDAEEESLF